MNTTIIKGKTITFEQLMKEFKKYVAGKNGFRGVLRCVYFDGKTFAATDTHVLLKVNAEYVSEIPEHIVSGSLINPATMEIPIDISGSYPDLNRLIPDYGKTEIILTNPYIKELHEHIKAAKKVHYSRNRNAIDLNFHYSSTEIITEGQTTKEMKDQYGDNYKEGFLKEIEDIKDHPKHLDEYSAKMNSLAIQGNELKIRLNDRFINNAFLSIKKLSKLSKEHVKLICDGSERPLVFTQENVFTVLVLPVRKY